MKIEFLNGAPSRKIFSQISAHVYRENKCYRGTESSIEQLLLHSKSAFHNHSTIKKFVIRDHNDMVARFAIIHDQRLPEYAQISFFEALPGLGEIAPQIVKETQVHFPQCSKMVVGLNGHLNYGAGILTNRFDEPPLFGLPYNPSYYPAYFRTFTPRKMHTFRFALQDYHTWSLGHKIDRTIEGLTIRFMDKKRIKEESELYTRLNNSAFTQHPYWANRDKAEDLELFYPFRFLLKNENLLFAEVHGKPVGFLLWYPDFNQLVKSQRDLNGWDVLKYRMNNSIDTFRFTEIGIIPEYQRTAVTLEMTRKILPILLNSNYKYCEGGFIFEENKASVAYAKRVIQRCYGVEAEPYRQFATYETILR